MSTQNLLEKFTEAKEKVEAHIEDNKPVFNAHQKLVMSLIDAENELRDAVAESKEGVTNGKYTVVCTPQEQVVFDEEKTLSALRVSREGALAAGVLVRNQRPPFISIKENK